MPSIDECKESDLYRTTASILGQAMADELWARCDWDAAKVAMQLQLIIKPENPARASEE